VIVFFERAGRFTRCEVHPRPGGVAEIIVTPPDGPPSVEILANPDVSERVCALETSMVNAGWWPYGRDV
jgi:hypothetical protein